MNFMISQPMKGLTEDAIRKTREQIVLGLTIMHHTVTDTIFSDTPPETDNQGLWYLGKSFQAMAAVDAVFFIEGWQDARGCWMEFEACKRYGIPTFERMEDVPDMRPPAYARNSHE